jgi:hypothetical protein
MVRVLLRLRTPPAPHDAADALAIAICHLHHAALPKPPRTAARTSARAKLEALLAEHPRRRARR